MSHPPESSGVGGDQRAGGCRAPGVARTIGGSLAPSSLRVGWTGGGGLALPSYATFGPLNGLLAPGRHRSAVDPVAARQDGIGARAEVGRPSLIRMTSVTASS